MIQVKQLTKDNLHVKVYGSRDEMGSGAAAEAAAYIREALKTKETLNIVFAAAPSQNEFLSSLLGEDVEWGRINAFHMDEYIGLPTLRRDSATSCTGTSSRKRLSARCII